MAGLTPPEWARSRRTALDGVDFYRNLETLRERVFSERRQPRSRACWVRRSSSELQRQGIGFVIDLTERKRAEAELAHANRVATMGQLAASIAHEVNQPIAALLTNAETAVRWLARQPPNLEKARPLIDRIISDGKRAADIVSRIRDFSKKAPARKGDLEINEAILEIMGLTRAAMSEHGVSVKMQLSEGLPRILGGQSPIATGDPELDHERH